MCLSKTHPRKYGHSGDFATNRLDEQEVAALSLHLLQICLVYTLSRDFIGDLGILQEDRLMAFQVSRERSCQGLRPLTPKHWKALIRSLR
jgi:hypothetical protein